MVYGWQVFNVVDDDGNKIKDKKVMDYIQRRIETSAGFVPSQRGFVGVMPSEEHTSIELAGTDRPGLFSEVCAVLADLHCNVVNAKIWTHNARAAAVVHVIDDSTGCAISDPKRLSAIKELLCNVLKGSDDLKTTKTMLLALGVMHVGRRLHQIMFTDRDYERVERARAKAVKDESSRPQVTLLNIEKDYTVITMRSKDQPKLLFDIVCTLHSYRYAVCCFSRNGQHRNDESLLGESFSEVANKMTKPFLTKLEHFNCNSTSNPICQRYYYIDQLQEFQLDKLMLLKPLV
ncbi:hypothetical protein REPUB_Repub06bG0113200 [Reevesia pubescens]